MKKIIEKVKAFCKNDVVRRTAKTFIQAFGGVLLAVNVADVNGLDSVKTIIISAFSAGICAVWNYIKVKIDEKLNK